MTPEEEIEKITMICKRTGVTDEQAKLMASRLIKRADQLALEREITRVEAMSHLLGLLVKGIES